MPTSGTYRLVWGTEETADILYNAPAKDITAALTAAGINDVVAAGRMDDPDGITISFGGLKADKHQPDIEVKTALQKGTNSFEVSPVKNIFS